MTFMYLAWTVSTLMVAVYGLADFAWQLMAASFVFNALEAAGLIVWMTTKQRLIPGRLLGRVVEPRLVHLDRSRPDLVRADGTRRRRLRRPSDARRRRAHRRRDHVRVPLPAGDAGRRGARIGSGPPRTRRGSAPARADAAGVGPGGPSRSPLSSGFSFSPDESSLMSGLRISDTESMKQRAWLLYLMAAEAALLAYLFVPGCRQGWFFNLIAVSSPIAIVCAVRMWNPEAKAPWYLFALGQTLFVAGDVITYNYDKFFGSELPFPSIGDVAYLSVYPCLIAGILLLVRRRSPGRDREGLIDSLIIAVGIGVISWVFLMGPDRARRRLDADPEAREHGLPVHGSRAPDGGDAVGHRARPARRRVLPDARGRPRPVRHRLRLQLHLGPGARLRPVGIPGSRLGELLHPLGRGRAPPVDGRARPSARRNKRSASPGYGSSCSASRR